MNVLLVFNCFIFDCKSKGKSQDRMAYFLPEKGCDRYYALNLTPMKSRANVYLNNSKQ